MDRLASDLTVRGLRSGRFRLPGRDGRPGFLQSPWARNNRSPQLPPSYGGFYHFRLRDVRVGPQRNSTYSTPATLLFQTAPKRLLTKSLGHLAGVCTVPSLKLPATRGRLH